MTSSASGHEDDGPELTGRSVPAGDSSPSRLLLSQACDAVTSRTNADGGAVTLMAPSGARELVYASNAVAHYLDDIQFTAGLGPCLDAFSSGQPVLCPDLRRKEYEHRWLAFANDATAAGAAAVFTFPLRVASTVFGVLELYRTRAGDPTPDEYAAMERGADIVGQVVLTYFGAGEKSDGNGAEELSQDGHRRGIWDSEFSRPQINYAAGMVSVQLNVTFADALSAMRARAYLEQCSLTEIADDVVAHRTTFTQGET
ncbi:GAF domain-containing protein [Rhodococcoides kyotonense]|uniref:GAF domain-containing protein n=1 Tax=Rhodococcoides kyotonense TaxID=398843 RepID=A0A177YHL2_9NOCA|nr:GAF domain-containing protein [Rhodococcus kyotonensis]OAK54790.1 hypothetical protein A3K89_05575 [Rhodococcus kyotonensis]